MNSCRARFLESPHASLAECLVFLAVGGIQLRVSDGRMVWISWEECQVMEKAGRLGRIAGLHATDSLADSVPFSLLVDEEACFSEIKEAWSRAMPASAQRRLDPEMRLVGLKLAALGLGVLGLLVCLYFVYANLYWIVPIQFDVRMGEILHTTSFAQQGNCQDASLQGFVAKAQEALRLPEDRLEHPIQVVPGTTVNAFAIPGGRIYLHQGLLARSQSPDEILGVIAHEMAHSELRHSTRQIWQGMAFALVLSMTFDPGAILDIASQLANLKYSREFEREADQQAVQRLHRIGVSPVHLESLLRRIAPANADSALDFLSSHPMGEERFRTFREQALPGNILPDTLFSAERTRWKQIQESKCP